MPKIKQKKDVYANHMINIPCKISQLIEVIYETDFEIERYQEASENIMESCYHKQLPETISNIIYGYIVPLLHLYKIERIPKDKYDKNCETTKNKLRKIMKNAIKNLKLVICDIVGIGNPYLLDDIYSDKIFEKCLSVRTLLLDHFTSNLDSLFVIVNRICDRKHCNIPLFEYFKHVFGTLKYYDEEKLKVYHEVKGFTPLYNDMMLICKKFNSKKRTSVSLFKEYYKKKSILCLVPLFIAYDNNVLSPSLDVIIRYVALKHKNLSGDKKLIKGSSSVYRTYYYEFTKDKNYCKNIIFLFHYVVRDVIKFDHEYKGLNFNPNTKDSIRNLDLVLKSMKNMKLMEIDTYNNNNNTDEKDIINIGLEDMNASGRYSRILMRLYREVYLEPI